MEVVNVARAYVYTDSISLRRLYNARLHMTPEDEWTVYEKKIVVCQGEPRGPSPYVVMRVNKGADENIRYLMAFQITRKRVGERRMTVPILTSFWRTRYTSVAHKRINNTSRMLA